MDTHDHKKTQPSGHEHHAVHLCHKCGWPFPNPHPSAKHRRAHKRVCGTLEGYKLVDSEEKPHSNPSDDEHDEDHITSDNPSPSVLERSEKDQGSGGSVARSYQSEDEVFADASASFSENAGEVSSGVERVLKGELNLVQIIEAGATDETIRQISHTSDSGTEEHHVGEKTTTDGLVDRPGSVDHMDHVSNSTSTLMEAHEPAALLNVYVDMSSDSVIVKSESQLDHKHKPSVDESAEVAISADPLLENVPHEADVVVNEESNQDGDISGSAIFQREDSRNPNELEKLDETEKLHASAVTPDEVLSNKGPGDMLISEKLTEDFSSGSVSLRQISLTAESAQIKVDSMQQLESANSANFVDASDAQPQENENFQVYSVPHDLPVIEQPEDLIRGFKDHKGMKIHQDDNLVHLDTRVLQDSLDASTNEDDSNVESKIRKEGSQMSSESPVLPDASEWKGENDKPVDKEEVPGGEKFSAQLSAANDVDQIKPDASTNEDCSKVESKTRKEGSQMSLDGPVLPDASEWKGENDKPVDKEESPGGEKFSAQLSAASDVDQIKPDASTNEDCSKVESKTRKEGSQMSLDGPVLPDASEWKGENDKPVDKEEAPEGEKFSAQLSAANDVDQIKPDASTNEDCSKVESKTRKEGSQMSLEGLVLPDASEWKGEKDKPVDKEGALEGEKFSAQLSAANDVDQIKPDASTNEDCSDVESKARKEGSQMSLESPVSPNASEWKGENNKPVDKEGPHEGEKFSAKFSAASDVDQLKPDAMEGLEDEKAEDNKNFHVLPVPHDSPLVEQPENPIEDFKDHVGMKMDRFDNLGSCETTVQEGNVVGSLDYSSSQLKTEKEDAKCSADVPEITAKAEELMLKPLDEEMLIERGKISGDKDPELKLDPSAGWNLSNPIGSVNDSNVKEEKNRNSHVHSVLDDVVVVDQAENMIEDFKDHKEKVYQLDDIGSSGTVSQRESSDIPVFEDRSISEPKTEIECTELFPFGLHDKQCTSGSEDESCKTINGEVPLGGTALPYSLQSVDEILEDKGKVLQESSMEEVETKHVVETHGREELKDINTSSLIVETPESASKMLTDVSPEVIDTLTEAHGTMSDNTGINEKGETDTYESIAGDHSRTAVEKGSLVSRTATKSADKLDDEQVNMTNKSIVDESVRGSEEQTGTKTESKDDNPLKEEIVLKVEASTHEAKEVRVISFDNSSAHLGSQDGDLAPEDGIKEDERDRSDGGEKPCIFGGVAVAETNASATEELHVNAIESGGSPTEHPITLPEENNTAMQQHPKSADIASNDDDSSKMVSRNGATKLILPTPYTMPPTPSNIAAEDQGGNGTSRIVPGPDSLMQEESDAAVKQGNGESVPDASLDSSGSLEGHWGSVSVLSTQSDTAAVGEAEALPSNDSRAALERGKSHTNSGKVEPKAKHTDKSDVFEPPSFMTLVERRGSNDQNAAASVPEKEQLKSPSVQAGWIPFLPHVANDSQGRKKNEEIIAKVTNWSTGKQHSPLKNLLVEANRDNKLNPTSPRENSASATRKEENALKDNVSGVATVGSILSTDAPDSGAAKKQVGQEWNSPARYPEDMKREKRKAKGRPYWVQFVCCASAN